MSRLPSIPLRMVSLCLALIAPPALAQQGTNLMVVLDGSGSMWGQIGGRTKIDLAREALSGVLSEAGQDMQIGLMAYGHRQRGQCGDIETLVPMGPAGQTIPRIIDRAYAVKPRGMTPIVDSVLAAAQQLSYREQAATVVLLTDGIETCGGDPCALGRMLEAQGIDFTAHVVGFDMTDAQQRQVACLATATGGLFLAARDADGLGRALRDTILTASAGPAVPFVPPPVPQPDPVIGPRSVEIYLRDTAGGEVLTGRALQAVTFVPLDEDGTAPDAVALRLGDRPWTLDGGFLPGRYEIQITRAGNRGTQIRTALAFEVPEGQGPHQVDLVIAARLRLTALAHTGLPMPDRLGNLPFATYGSDSGRAQFRIHPVIGGAIDPSVDYGGTNSLDIALPPGDYFIRGTLARTFARERLIRVAPGAVLDYTFDFQAARVFVDLRDGAGRSSTRQTIRFFDGEAPGDFMYGGGERAAQWKPFYLPVGNWRITAQNETGAKERAEAVVAVSAPGADVVAEVRAGDGLTDAMRAQLMDEGSGGCLARGPGGGICFVEVVTPASMARDLPSGTPSAGLLAPRYSGTWDMDGTLVALVQDGRRVWGDVHGSGRVSRLYGELAADGLTLRGTMTGTGIFEFRLSPDGLGFTGASAHFGGGDTGTRVAETLVNAQYTARKLSAAPPPLVMADGTQADLHPAFRNGAVPAFEAFMAPVRTAAPPGAGNDLDLMQSMAPWLSLGGTWDTSSRVLHLHQDHRRIWGERETGVLEGELSPDGQTLRGTWSNTDGQWGLLEFVLSDDGQTFEGRWGRNLDPDLKGGKWTGRRSSWLAAQPRRATGTAADRPQGASGAVFDAFMDPVRGPDPLPLTPTAPVQSGDFVIRGDFVPAFRFDYTHPDGRPAISFVFAEAETGGDFGIYNPGYALMHAGWCGGPECPGTDVVPVGGPTMDEVPNALDRLFGAGVFPALDLFTQGIAVFESDDGVFPDRQVHVHILREPYTEDRQLGAGRGLILQSFGPYPGTRTDPATMAGFPLAQPVPLPPIGQFDHLPTGIFASEDLGGGETLEMAFARIADPDAMPARGGYCTTNPTVIHDDGLIAERQLRIGQAASSGPAYETVTYRRCTHAGPILNCDEVFAPLGPVPEPPDRSFVATLALGPQDSFALIPTEPGIQTRVYQNCLVPTDLADVHRPASDGRPMLDHLGMREDGGPPLSGPLTGPAPAPAQSGAALDFGAIGGVWGRDSGGDPRLACVRSPALVQADGRIAIWGSDATGNPALLAQLACQTSGACTVLATNLPPGAGLPVPSLSLAADRLNLCADGNCTPFLRCPMADLPPDLAAHLAGQMAAAPAAGAGAETPAAMIPPGVWLVEAPFAGPIPAPGTEAFRAACYDTPAVAYPDGLILSFEMRAEAAGPAYSVVYSEICAPSGDGQWPLTCRSEDAHVADAAAAQTEVRARILARGNGSFRQVIAAADGSEESYVYHACQPGDGSGIDLGADPLGPVLTAAARAAR